MGVEEELAEILDPFEGHYSLDQILDKEILEYYEQHGNVPQLVRVNPEWLRDMIKHLTLYDRPEPYSPYRTTCTEDRLLFNTSAGRVRLCSDREISRSMIFEFE